MTKTRWLLGIALVVVVVALLFSYGRLTENTLVVDKQMLSESGQSPNGAGYVIEIEYPLLVGGDEAGTRAANQYITAAARTEASSFIADLAEPGNEMVATSSLTGGYQLSQITPDRLSLEMNYLAELSGAAHPNNFTKTINYDLARERTLEITDIIGNSPADLTRLAGFAKADLIEQFNNDDSLAEWIEEGTAPLPENYRKFTLTNDSLILIFDPYVVAPYAAGVVRVTVPLSALDQV